MERVREFFRDQAEIESLFVGMSGNPAKSLGEQRGIAMSAAR